MIAITTNNSINVNAPNFDFMLLLTGQRQVRHAAIQSSIVGGDLAVLYRWPIRTGVSQLSGAVLRRQRAFQ
jgi:hypothetical protein